MPQKHFGGPSRQIWGAKTIKFWTTFFPDFRTQQRVSPERNLGLTNTNVSVNLQCVPYKLTYIPWPLTHKRLRSVCLFWRTLRRCNNQSCDISSFLKFRQPCWKTSHGISTKLGQIWGAKNIKFWTTYFTLSHSTPHISGTKRPIDKQKYYCQSKMCPPTSWPTFRDLWLRNGWNSLAHCELWPTLWKFCISRQCRDSHTKATVPYQP